MALILPKKEINSLQHMIDTTKDRCRRLGIIVTEGNKRFRELIIKESQNRRFSLDALKDLAKYLDIHFEPPPKAYDQWYPSFCASLISVKYVNPQDHREYITIPTPRSPIGSIQVLHHYPTGYQCVEYFNAFIPRVSLQELVAKYYEGAEAANDAVFDESEENRMIVNSHLLSSGRGNFSRTIAKNVMIHYSDLEEYTVRVLHAFFDIYVPYVDGVCSNCFKISLPDNGFGIKYDSVVNDAYNKLEIRVSPPKPDGDRQQRYLYVTNMLQVHGKKMYLGLCPHEGIKPIFTTQLKLSDESLIFHHPWESHYQPVFNSWLSQDDHQKKIQEFLNTKSQIMVPLCQCK